MKKATITVIFLISLIGFTSAQTAADPNFELYILIGQSNMAGRGPATPGLQNDSHPRVFMFGKDHQWISAKHPLHFDKPKAAAIGPGLAFGIDMAEANANARIGLIPCAVGGTAIEQWAPGAFDKATKTHPYDDAIVRIKMAMRSGVIRGVIWHQGEANSSEKKAKRYLNKLDTLITRIRQELGNPTLPFIFGELGRYRDRYSLINEQLAKVPNLIPFTALVTSEGLTHRGDSTHFDGPSANMLGHRFAKKMIEIQHGKP